MKWISILFLAGTLLSADVKPTNTTGQTDPCRVYGAIYIEEFPENAQFLVYEEESEAFAGMLIFEEDNRLMADKSGKWFFTDNKAFARYSVYFVDKKNHADFSVYFTNFESMAGCKK
ncbi:MAG: DUF6150 family protein [Cyclobacteriaceae bacterium]